MKNYWKCVMEKKNIEIFGKVGSLSQISVINTNEDE
jgi:hypothetical protein